MNSKQFLKEVVKVFKNKKYSDDSYKDISLMFEKSDILTRSNAIAILKKENSVYSTIPNLVTIFGIVVAIMASSFKASSLTGIKLSIFYLFISFVLLFMCFRSGLIVERNTYIIEIAEKLQNTYTTDKMNNEQISEKKTISTEERLLENFGESTGFYKMVKRHANLTFYVAIISLFIGLILFGMGFVGVIWYEKDVAFISLFAGSFTEVISGTIFLLHKKSVEELNELHKRLNSTERYLTSIMLAERLTAGEKERAYRWILENCILTDVEIQTGVVMRWRHGDKAN